MATIYASRNGVRRTCFPMGVRYMVEICGVVELYHDSLEAAKRAAAEWIYHRPSKAAFIYTLEGDRIGDSPVAEVIGKNWEA